jgi:hypothetical protein
MTVQDVARQLPDIAVVRDRSRSLAMLDAILSPEWEYRYYSFDASWGPAQELASMRNGSGDDYAIVFSPAGAWVRVFDHESPMSPWALEPPRPWPGVLDTVPTAFQACVQEPAFTLDGVVMVSVCLWRQTTDDRWQTGVIDFPAGRGTQTAARGCWSCYWTTLQRPIGGSPRTTTSSTRWTWRPCGKSMRCGP